MDGNLTPHDVDDLLREPARRLQQADVVKAAAADVALAHGLPVDWLNDAALAYIPPVGADDWIEVVREGSVTISIGSPQMLLAMKLYANRGRRDADDIDYLLGVCGVTTVQDAQEI